MVTLEYTGPRARDCRRFWSYRDAEGNAVEYTCPVHSWRPPKPFIEAYEVTGDVKYAAHSMTMAGIMTNLVAGSFRDGWEHGCAHRQFAHGAGYVAIEVLARATGLEKVRYFNADGAPGLETGIAVLIDPKSADDELTLHMYNDLEEARTIRVGAKDPEKQVRAVTVQGEAGRTVDGQAIVQLEPKQGTHVRITLTV